MLITWLACHLRPSVSGPDGLVGNVVEAAGQPVAGLRVRSLEAEGTTGSDGHFAVWFKAPEQFVQFDWHGLSWQRRLLPSDVGRVVQIGLPPVSPRQLDCGRVRADVVLAWDLADGLRGTLPARCGRGGAWQADLPPGAPVVERGPVGDVAVRATELGIVLEMGTP